MKKLKLSPPPENTSSQGDTGEGDHGYRSAKTEIVDLQVTKQGVRQTDPLKIDLILERIFDFCSDVKTLKNSRLVSTQWRDGSLKTWRDNAILVLSMSSDATDFEELYFNYTKYLELLESDQTDDDNDALLRNLKKHPFKRFCFVGYEDLHKFSNENTRLIADSARFLTIHSFPNHENDTSHISDITELRDFLEWFQSVEELQFQNCFNEDYNFHYNSDFEIELPKLKRLTIEQNSKSNVGIWARLLKWFPNLEALSLPHEFGRWSTCYVGIKSILTSLKTIRQTGGQNVLSLKELEIYVPESFRTEKDIYPSLEETSNEEIIQTIVDCNFPLEKLSISLGWRKICRLLEFHKDTLKYLKTSFHFDSSLYHPSFGFELWPWKPDLSRGTICLKKVKEASLGNGHHYALYLLTRLKLPNLEKLTIEKDNSGERDSRKLSLSFPNGRICKRLETLEFFDDLKNPSPSTIETLIKIMPNLVHLTIPLDKRTFQIVCKKLTGLKTLNILSAKECHEELNDESLTGVSLDSGKEGDARPPNITDLARLTDLKIFCHSPLLRNDVKFTDHSVTHGFLQLPCLYSLSIAFRHLSEDMRAKLLKHVKGNVEIQERPTIDDCCTVTMGNEQETNWEGASEEEESCISESE